MADNRQCSTKTSTDSSVTAKHGPGLIFLVIRSYEEARMVFAVILTINVVVIVLDIIFNTVISFVMLRKNRCKIKGMVPIFFMHLAVVELLYRFLAFPIIIVIAWKSFNLCISQRGVSERTGSIAFQKKP